jgi:histidinol-phosphatase (PHP family)
MPMPITADYHLHSSFSGDSETGMEEMILRGIAAGLDKLCFTEHLDLDYPATDTLPEGYFLLDTDTYFAELESLRAKYAAQISVLSGVELGLQPHLAAKHTGYVQAHDFDFVIASSHLSNGKDPYWPEFFAGRSDQEAFRDYFESILLNIRNFNDFDVYGHLDFAIRYSKNRDLNYYFDDYRDLFEGILTSLVNLGKGLEINTGGIRYGLKELHPSTAILKRYRELGGEILTIGSDAHTAPEIAREFEMAANVLADCGFKYYTVFEKRVAEYVKI